MLVADADVEFALETLADERGAASRAAHEYLDDCTKSLLAKLKLASAATSDAARETEARADPKFIAHLKVVRDMAEEDYKWRDRKSAADAKLRIWQTQSANNRGMERVR